MVGALLQNHLFATGFILLSGYILGRAAQMVRLPEISGFIVAGLLAGPYFGGIIDARVAEDLALLSEIALGVIAFTVGSNVQGRTFVRMGRSVLLITLGHLAGGLILVSVSLTLVGLPLPVAIVMGVLAGGSSPGTVVAVVQSVRARGPFVEHLFGVVAMATAATITAFGMVLSFLPLLARTDAVRDMTFGAVLGGAILRIIFSVGIGALGGGRSASHDPAARRRAAGDHPRAQSAVHRNGRRDWNGGIRASERDGIRFVFVNISPAPRSVLQAVGSISPPLFAVFFVLAGGKLNPAILGDTTVLLYGLVYVVARVAGSYSCTNLTARLSGTTPRIRRYLPMCLVPQAGVVLGLVLILEQSPVVNLLPPDIAAAVAQTVTIILLAVLIKEIAGPPVSAWALRRGVGEP